jgi:uncharacterized protein
MKFRHIMVEFHGIPARALPRFWNYGGALERPGETPLDFLYTVQRMSSSIRIAVYIQPRAKRTEITGRHGSDLKIRVAAPPIGQAANEMLLAFIAHRLGVRPREVRLIAGGTSRRKVLEIDGVTAEQIQVLLT